MYHVRPDEEACAEIRGLVDQRPLEVIEDPVRKLRQLHSALPGSKVWESAAHSSDPEVTILNAGTRDL